MEDTAVTYGWQVWRVKMRWRWVTVLCSWAGALPSQYPSSPSMAVHGYPSPARESWREMTSTPTSCFGDWDKLQCHNGHAARVQALLSPLDIRVVVLSTFVNSRFHASKTWKASSSDHWGSKCWTFARPCHWVYICCLPINKMMVCNASALERK